MSRKWFNLEAQTDDAIFGGETPSYNFLGLTRTQRLGGFAACEWGDADSDSDSDSLFLARRSPQTQPPASGP